VCVGVSLRPKYGSLWRKYRALFGNVGLFFGNVRRHTCKRVTSHICMRRVAQTYYRVFNDLWVCAKSTHVWNHMNESHHTFQRVALHI